MAARAKRPRVAHLKACSLAAGWQQLAALKDPGFRWDGSQYQSGPRSKHGSSQQLIMHMEPLQVLLGMAPSGFPSFLDLRQSIMLLDNVNNIPDVDHQHNKFTMATMAAEKAFVGIDPI